MWIVLPGHEWPPAYPGSGPSSAIRMEADLAARSRRPVSLVESIFPVSLARLSHGVPLDVDGPLEHDNIANLLVLIHWLRLMMYDDVSALLSIHPNSFEILFCALVNLKGVKCIVHVT